MFFSFIFFLSLIFMSETKGNEVINIKTQDRGNYIRFIFELREKPEYFVYQLGEKIYLKLKDTKSYTDIKINNLSVKATNNDIEYTILSKINSLKRYLYTESDKNTKYFRVIVDIYRDEQSFENIGNFLSTKISLSDEEKTIDDLVAEFSDITLDELIKENIKPENLDELIALNNIIDEKVAEDLEKQNNDGIDLESFIQQISGTIVEEIPTENDFEFVKINKKRKNKRFLIVIDAGHGGADSGAIGNMSTKEKDINLIFAKEIAKQLEKNRNFEVYLTRNNDKFISLKNRVVIARKMKANLFISIHSDSNPNKNVRGLSLYTLPKKKESISLGFSRNRYIFRQKSRISNTNSKKYAESDKFVNILLQKFSDQEINTLFNPHKYANFAVLVAPEFPSVLIELGFLSNLQDEKMLNSDRYKRKVSLAVSQSINRYFGYY